MKKRINLAAIMLLMTMGLATPVMADEVQVLLADIEQRLANNPAPDSLPAPFDDAVAGQWHRRAVAAREAATLAIETTTRLAETVDLPLTRGTVAQGAPYDRQDLSRLNGWAQRILRQVDEAVQETNNNLRFTFEHQDRELNYFRQLDPARDHDRMNAFLAEDAEERIYSRLDQQLALAESLAAWQRAFGREPAEVIVARIEEIHALRARYGDQRRQALGDSKLPEPRSRDRQRLQIAQQILANPRYGFGEHGPIVLTTNEVVEREREVSRAEINQVEFSLSGDITLTGSQQTWHYRWQEFGFVTPIRDADTGRWHLWWITAKNYASGWEGTPIGQWVSGSATRGDEIPRGNF